MLILVMVMIILATGMFYAPRYLAYSTNYAKVDAVIILLGPDSNARLRHARDLIKKGMIVYFDKAASGTKIQVSKSEPEEYTIGDYGPSGGVIFYDKGNSNGGWRYLEAAPDDQSNGIQWVNESYQYIGMTGTRIGTGRANTKKIVAVQGDGTYAAKICADYQGGGRSDWFLPSKDELAAMRTVLTEIQVKGFAGEFYWSSSEVDGSLAWLQVSKSNNQYGDGKDYTAHVRAIRAF